MAQVVVTCKWLHGLPLNPVTTGHASSKLFFLLRRPCKRAQQPLHLCHGRSEQQFGQRHRQCLSGKTPPGERLQSDHSKARSVHQCGSRDPEPLRTWRVLRDCGWSGNRLGPRTLRTLPECPNHAGQQHHHRPHLPKCTTEHGEYLGKTVQIIPTSPTKSNDASKFWGPSTTTTLSSQRLAERWATSSHFPTSRRCAR